MKKLFLLFFLLHHSLAKLPLSFVSLPTVNNVTIGQPQVLNYTIRNELKNKALPIKNIQVINDGDAQPAGIASIQSTCPPILFPQVTCKITVTLQNVRQGNINRHLSIAYGGRKPLNAPIKLQTKQAAYTVLVYIVASDLETDSDAATANIDQMKEIGSTGNMNIVIETGGSNKPGFDTVKRKLIVRNGEIVLQDLGSLNMGLKSTIQDFLQWGMINYPADKFIIIFWNHGGGPNGGFGADQVHDNTATPINQIADVVRSATALTGKKFEIIGFDACFMGNIETISGVYPYTNYFVGSEDLEPGRGWQYNTFLNFINTNPFANGLEVGRVIVDGFTKQNEGQSTTLSVVSSAEMPSLLNALNQFSIALSPFVNSTVDNWKLIARSRLRTPDYGTSVWERESYDVADLIGIAKNMALAFPEDQFIQSTAAWLIAETENAVKYYKNSENRGASFGVTIYFPSILASYKINYPTKTFLDGNSFFSIPYVNIIANYHAFYQAYQSSLIAEPFNLLFNGTDYTATISNDFEEAYASVGNDFCTNVYDARGRLLPAIPCYTSLQSSSNINVVPGSGNTSNVEFNKEAHLKDWPLINNVPALLITLDTEPVIPNEISYLIPVTRVEGVKNGYLSIVKNDQNEFIVVGFQETAGNINSQGKVMAIENGEKFYLRTYALTAQPGLFRTNTIITAPFTITFGELPVQFNAFRFLVADLTGSLNITETSVPY